MKNWCAVLLLCCLALASQAGLWNRGKLTVNFKDNEGKPITNATLIVKTSNSLGWSRGGNYYRYEAKTDEKGVASLSFRYLIEDFSWEVVTPDHHSERFGSRSEKFNSETEELDLYGFGDGSSESAAELAELEKLAESNTVESYTNLIAKLQPKKVVNGGNEIVRSVSFFPKRNPQPMCSYANCKRRDIALPTSGYVPAPKEGEQVEDCGTVEYDIKVMRPLGPWGARDYATPGKVSDFKVVRYHVETNGIKTLYGYIEFAEGCGAYKCTMKDDCSMLTDYEADTNAVYVSKWPFCYHCVNGKRIEAQNLLQANEYFVCRTRVMTDSCGAVTNCNYSKIIGDMYVGSRVNFKAIIFNPRPNDPNLEFDMKENLADSVGGWGGKYCP